MKRLFTLLLGAMAVALSYAQVVEFRYYGQPVADGETVTIEAEVDDTWGWLEITCNTNPPTALDRLVLHRLSGTNTYAGSTAVIEEVSNTIPYTMKKFCMGGECVPVSTKTFTKTFSFNLGDNVLPQYDIDIPENGYGEMLTKMTVTVGGETKTIYIKFVYTDTAGINRTTSNSNATEVVRYSLNGQRMSTPQKGINIVKMSDGTTRKVAR